MWLRQKRARDLVAGSFFGVMGRCLVRREFKPLRLQLIADTKQPYGRLLDQSSVSKSSSRMILIFVICSDQGTIPNLFITELNRFMFDAKPFIAA